MTDEQQKIRSRKQLCEIRKFWHNENTNRVKRISLTQAMFKWCECGKAAEFEINFDKGESK